MTTKTAKTIYVAGFLFDYPVNNVILIKKTKPEWQAGLLNGVGGKVNEGETPASAMQREFNEEAGVWVDKWEKFLILTGSDYDVHFFRAFCKPEFHTLVLTMTDETVLVVKLKDLYINWVEQREKWRTIPNLQYIIPMALDCEIRTSSIYLL